MDGQRTLTTRGAARRAALLDAAISVVASGGSGSLTHRAVAASADVSLASVTYHFASIEELRRSTFARALAVLDDELARAAENGGSLERMPRVYADYVAALLTQHRDAVVTVNEMVVAANHDEHLRPTFHAYQEHFAELLDPCVGGREAGLMVAAALQGLILTAVTYRGEEVADDGARWRAAVVDLISRVRSHAD